MSTPASSPLSDNSTVTPFILESADADAATVILDQAFLALDEPGQRAALEQYRITLGEDLDMQMKRDCCALLVERVASDGKMADARQRIDLTRRAPAP